MGLLSFRTLYEQARLALVRRFRPGVLGEREWCAVLANGAVKGYDHTRIGAASIDIHVGDRALVIRPEHEYWRHTENEPIYSLDNPPPPEAYEEVTLPVVLRPGDFLLVDTREWFDMPLDMCAQVCARSSWRRMGGEVSGDAGFIDNGFSGTVTLEVGNDGATALLLRPGDRIGQVVAWFTCSPSRAYKHKGRYNQQQGPTAAR